MVNKNHQHAGNVETHFLWPISKHAPQSKCNAKFAKKLGHYTSLCTAKMPERRPPRGPTNNTSPQVMHQQTRRVKHIKQGLEESDHTEESVDAEAALYIKEFHEDWANINIIQPMEFVQKRNDEINKDPYGEFWVETTTAQNKVQWLADTSSPRSIMNIDIATKLQQEIPTAKNIRIYRNHSLQKFHKQQYRNKRSTFTRTKFRIMDS